MPRSVDEVLASVGVPVDALLAELEGIASRNPDLRGLVDAAKAKVLEKFSPEAIAAKAAGDAAELIFVLREGHGLIDRDNITDIQ